MQAPSKKQNNRQRGFTLIELLVSIFVLSVALSLISAIFLSSFVAQRKVITIENTNSNARALMETLSREVRASRICGNTRRQFSNGYCLNPFNNTGPNELDNRLDIIRNSDNKWISYCVMEYPAGSTRYTVTRVEQTAGSFALDPCNSGTAGLNYLTSSGVQVIRQVGMTGLGRRSGFMTLGVGLATPAAAGYCRDSNGMPVIDVCQPRTTIVLEVESLTQRNNSELTNIKEQTTISQRLIDVP
jgi:prepilin-type N-terminal cleavage/methylation domain-containing protein